jgi:uncharacterized membrane protein YbhN (UPF0104 family)
MMKQEQTTLTTAERAFLDFYLRHRDSAPSVSLLLIRSIKAWALTAILFAAAAAAIVWIARDLFNDQRFAFLMGGVVLGMLIGAIARDVGYAIRIVRRWRVLMLVMDWPKVEILLASQRGMSGSEDKKAPDEVSGGE